MVSGGVSISLPEWIVRLGEFVLGAWLILTAVGMALGVAVVVVAAVLVIAGSRR